MLFKVLPIMENLLMYSFVIVFYVSEGISTLMTFSDGLGPYIFRRKMEGMRPIRIETHGMPFIFRQSQHVL